MVGNLIAILFKVSVYLQNWSHVLSYVNKAESTPDFAEVLDTHSFFYKPNYLNLWILDLSSLQTAKMEVRR